MSARTRYQALVDLITPEFVRTAFPGPLDRYQEGVYGADARDAPELLQSFERCIEWARSHGAINDANEAKIRKGKYPWLTLGAVSREAAPHQLDLLCDTITWIVIADDVIDSYDGAAQGSLDDVRHTIGSFIHIFRDPSAAVADSGSGYYGGLFGSLCTMARSVSERIWKCHPALARPAVQSIIDYLNSITVEFCYTHDDLQIDPWSYLELRARSVAVLPLLDITLLTNGIVISTTGIKDVTVTHICTLGVAAVAILNDLISFPSEVRTAGNVLNNFVTFEYDLLEDIGIPPQDAARLALDRCITRYRGYRQALFERTPWIPADVNRAGFLNGFNDVITSMMEWHLGGTDRYMVAGE